MSCAFPELVCNRCPILCGDFAFDSKAVYIFRTFQICRLVSEKKHPIHRMAAKSTESTINGLLIGDGSALFFGGNGILFF